MNSRAIPNALAKLLREHAAAYAPHYPPSDNSDHGPMAYLAMHGLGIDVAAIQRFSENYRTRLAPVPPLEETVSRDQWQRHVGRRESYSALVAFFETEISQHGWPDTVRRYLPTLISGWVKDAFHPLIRLGYGIEFVVPSEIAAGLAYLTIAGDDPRLTRLASLGSSTEDGSFYLEQVRTLSEPRFSRGPFNARYERILRTAALQSANGTSHYAFGSISRACLDVFDASHDFFALHLVTSSHAFRVCVPYGGANAFDLFAVGIAIGYLAIGAPAFARLDRLTASLPLDRLKCATDVHDIKIAYSCRVQAQAYDDPTYEWAATRYLMPRLPGTA